MPYSAVPQYMGHLYLLNNNTMTRFLSLVLICLMSITVCGQDDAPKKERKGFNIKKPNLRIGEKIGSLAGNLMTAKTSDLGLTVLKTSMVCGIYPPEIKTSEAKYFPDNTQEGDFFVSITFMKNAGMGMYQILGDVTCDGQAMEYVGLGSYSSHFPGGILHPKTIHVTTETGGEASITLTPTPGVDIVSINGESTLPILDMEEDIVLEYFNPKGSENTRIRISLITDVAGARALNHFADFPAGELGLQKITIPAASLASPEIAGQLNAGNFNKGENFLIVEREIITERDQMGDEQKLDQVGTAEIKVRAYAAKPVIVKGKQDGGLLVSMRVNGELPNGVGFDVYKPNASTGIPFNMASAMGLVSFTLTGDTYNSETTESSSSWVVGDTKYTRTTTSTTTHQFPQLPDEQWEGMMDVLYANLTGWMGSNMGIEAVPVSAVTSTTQYPTLFPPKDKNTYAKVSCAYAGTNRVDPSGLVEIFSGVSSNITSDVPMVNMMKESNTDMLLSLKLDLRVGGDGDGHVVLLPTLSYSLYGRDETNSSKQGMYAQGVIRKNGGVPFNETMVQLSPTALAEACSVPELLAAMQQSILQLQAKEIELGYQEVWGMAATPVTK